MGIRAGICVTTPCNIHCIVRFVEFNVGQLYIYIKSGVVYVSCSTNLDCVDDAPCNNQTSALSIL